MVKVGAYNYEKSTRPTKKLMVRVKGKLIHFGSRAMEHYKDKTGIWKSKDHNDPVRRKSYRARAGGIKNKEGKKTVSDPTSANFHAFRVLW